MGMADSRIDKPPRRFFRENRSSIEGAYVVQTAALLSSNSVAHIEALRRAGLPAR